MTFVGCDLHTRKQQVAVLDTHTGEVSEHVLDPASDKIVAQIPTGISPHFVGHPRGSALGMVVVQGLHAELDAPAPGLPPRSTRC